MNAKSAPETATVPVAGNSNAEQPPTSFHATPLTGAALGKPNDWVVIPVFADMVKLALGERENCLQRFKKGHINMAAFDRMAAIVGAFTRHMQPMKATQALSSGEYEHFAAYAAKYNTRRNGIETLE
ncbi:GL26502 [Drosophila persimilis]|uniref:GL26502 n=1 Tax=Drosophila persimilis TaxID=7234 RepID=B4GSE7_DROPE|nr:GL26502 [Drosophila persimilis]